MIKDKKLLFQVIKELLEYKYGTLFPPGEWKLVDIRKSLKGKSFNMETGKNFGITLKGLDFSFKKYATSK